MIDFDNLKMAVDRAYNTALKSIGKGEVASYIPELAKVDSNALAVSVMSLDGTNYSVGDDNVRFTIQSIGKVISFLAALELLGEDKVFSVVGMEASGDAFNSVVRLETNAEGIPSNPMINAGAIAVCSLIPGDSLEERFGLLLEIARNLLGDANVLVDEKVYLSERATGSRNKAMAYLMNANGIISDKVEEHLNLYFMLCSLLVTSKSLAYLGAVLAGDGIAPTKRKKRLISRKNARLARAMMVTSGMYDASGKFAAKVGCPSKSGVGGGIMSVVPKKMGIGVYSPALDEIGNSFAGQEALFCLSNELDLFVY